MKPALPTPPPATMQPLLRNPRLPMPHAYCRNLEVRAALAARERQQRAAWRRAVVLAVLGAIVALAFVAWGMWVPVNMLPFHP